MSLSDPIIQLLAYELAVIFFVLSLWLIFRRNKTNKRVHNDATKIVKQLSKEKSGRIEALTQKLTDKYGLTGEALTQAVSDFQGQEQQINKTVVSLFVEQDGNLLLSAPEQLSNVIDACLDLLPVGGGVIVEGQQQVSLSLNEQIDAAQLKLDLLMAELKETFGSDESSKPEP